MGSFSWLKADTLTKVANVVQYKPFKFLIPKEFGGGFIKDYYQDYGYLGTKPDGTPKYDMFELLAFWNADMVNYLGKPIREQLQYHGEFPLLKEQDEFTDKNRDIGIEINSGPSEKNWLKYPLKLVSASFKGTYEDCKGFSVHDPVQGFHPIPRAKMQIPDPQKIISKKDFIEQITAYANRYNFTVDTDLEEVYFNDSFAGCRGYLTGPEITVYVDAVHYPRYKDGFWFPNCPLKYRIFVNGNQNCMRIPQGAYQIADSIDSLMYRFTLHNHVKTLINEIGEEKAFAEMLTND